MNAFGVHGCSVITALTAQNTQAVHSVEPVSKAMFLAQLDALKEDLAPAAVKTGMLGSIDICRALAGFLSRAPLSCPFICDPVLQSTSGADLLAPEALDILVQGILPKATLVTPNLAEAEILAGVFRSVEEAAERVLEKGVCSVLITGGHAGDEECRDYWTDGNRSMWLSSPRIDTEETHGTGCILSSAIASAIAIGQDIPEAVITAKTFLNQCLKYPANVGTGPGPMLITSFKNREADRPGIA